MKQKEIQSVNDSAEVVIQCQKELMGIAVRLRMAADYLNKSNEKNILEQKEINKNGKGGYPPNIIKPTE